MAGGEPLCQPGLSPQQPFTESCYLGSSRPRPGASWALQVQQLVVGTASVTRNGPALEGSGARISNFCFLSESWSRFELAASLVTPSCVGALHPPRLQCPGFSLRSRPSPHTGVDSVPPASLLHLRPVPKGLPADLHTDTMPFYKELIATKRSCVHLKGFLLWQRSAKLHAFKT